MIYKKAAAELIRFDNSDVIITSAENGECPGYGSNKALGTCPASSNHNDENWDGGVGPDKEEDECRGNSSNKNW